MNAIDANITYSIDTRLTVASVTELLGDFAVDYNVDMIVFAYNADLDRVRSIPSYFRCGHDRPSQLREFFWHLTEVYDMTSDGYGAHMAELFA